MNRVEVGRDHRKVGGPEEDSPHCHLLVVQTLTPRDQEDRKSLLIQEYEKERREGWLRTKEAVLNKA